MAHLGKKQSVFSRQALELWHHGTDPKQDVFHKECHGKHTAPAGSGGTAGWHQTGQLRAGMATRAATDPPAAHAPLHSIPALLTLWLSRGIFVKDRTHSSTLPRGLRVQRPGLEAAVQQDQHHAHTFSHLYVNKFLKYQSLLAALSPLQIN